MSIEHDELKQSIKNLEEMPTTDAAMKDLALAYARGWLEALIIADNALAEIRADVDDLLSRMGKRDN